MRFEPRPQPKKRRYQPLDGLGPDGLPYRPRPSRWRLALLGASTLWGLVLSAVYSARPDAAAALTLFPFWVAALPGLILLALGTGRSTIRVAPVVAVLWLAALAVFNEEPRSLARGMSAWPADGWHLARRSGRAVRVITLNCNGGLTEAAAEAVAHKPDILLLQEAPARAAVDALARRLFGDEAGVVWGPDTAIIAHGRVSPALLSPDLHLRETRARVTLAFGPVLEVVSLRLEPPLVRADLFNPGAWIAQARNRRARRAQVRAVVEDLQAVPADVPLLVAGDFNAPAGDAAMRPLLDRARDMFPEGGRGWGHTVLNETPVLRIDQVWASPQFLAGSVTAHRTNHSDHRLVVADLWLSP